MIKVGIISLGCDKNRVDTENMLGFISEHFDITNSPQNADVIIVNTCAFLQKAREEAVDTILEAKGYNPKKLIVTGCLPQKFVSEMFDEFTEVDAFVGTGRYHEMVEIIREVVASDNRKNYVCENLISKPSEKRILTTPYHSAYLKIAEGCNNHCTYCLIPKIRGKYSSFDFQDILSEAKTLTDSGVKELILIAQDVTKYGEDNGQNLLVELINEISKLDVEWIRLMYCYPEGVSDRLIQTILENSKVVKYIDIPLQHCEDNILKLMGRHITKEQICNLLFKLKKAGISVRSTFIVGFPSESEKDFLNLLDFLREWQLDNVGFFAYSREENTAAYNLPSQITDKIKQERLEACYDIQRKIVESNNINRLGETVLVMCEGIDDERGKFFGRTQTQALDVDGRVYLTSKKLLEAGKTYMVKLREVIDYDFLGEVQSEFTE